MRQGLRGWKHRKSLSEGDRDKRLEVSRGVVDFSSEDFSSVAQLYRRMAGSQARAQGFEACRGKLVCIWGNGTGDVQAREEVQ